MRRLASIKSLILDLRSTFSTHHLPCSSSSKQNGGGEDSRFPLQETHVGAHPFRQAAEQDAVAETTPAVKTSCAPVGAEPCPARSCVAAGSAMLPSSGRKPRLGTPCTELRSARSAF